MCQVDLEGEDWMESKDCLGRMDKFYLEKRAKIQEAAKIHPPLFNINHVIEQRSTEQRAYNRELRAEMSGAQITESREQRTGG